MVSLEKEKKLGLAFTIAAAVLFAALSVFAVVLAYQASLPPSIESLTMIGLQMLAFVLLIVGMVFHKENLVLGTLVAVLVSSAVSYLIGDVSGFVSNPLTFKEDWYLITYRLSSIVANGSLVIGTVALLVFLLWGRKKGSRKVSGIFFIIYLAVTALGSLVPLLVASLIDSPYFVVFVLAISDFVSILAYIVAVNSYFFRSQRQQVRAAATPKEKEKARESLSLTQKVIADYRESILATSYTEKDGAFVLKVDLTDSPLYQDFSGKTLLNEGLYAFVEDVAFTLAEGQQLTLDFLFPENTSEEEKQKVFAIFKAHYALRYENMRNKLTKEMIMAISFVFVGFLLITVHLPYVAANSSSVYGEMLDIFGWVFTWEAVEILCVNSLDNQGELQRFKALYLARFLDAIPEEKK
jgi:hypothetical protein